MDGLTKKKQLEAVPKFASFRPKVPPSQTVYDEGDEVQVRPSKPKNGSSAYTEEQSQRRHGKEHSQSSRRSEPGARHRLTPKREKERGNQELGKRQHVESLNDAVNCWDETPESYVLDGAGDVDNLKYSSLHRYSIPSYRRSGGGSIVGLQPNEKIDRVQSSEKYLVVGDSQNDRPARKDTTEFVRARTKREVRIRPLSQNSEHVDHTADFLPLARDTNRKRKREQGGDGSDASSSADEADTHYRSIEGRAKPSQKPEDSDLEYHGTSYLSDGELGGSFTWAESIRQTSAQLMKRVDLEPTNAEAWLELIAHQDKAVQVGQNSFGQKLTSAERSSLADIKLSMYEKAIQKAKDPQSMERLLLGMMEQGAQIWDTGKLSTRWKVVLREHPQYTRLWTKYIDFQQTKSSNFRVDELRDCYADCIRILEEAASSITRPAHRQDEISIIRTYVVLRLTLFLRESGFIELAVAIWQALLEFNFCRPMTLSSSDSSPDYDRALESFEAFWESEVPRIGEEGSLGWADFSMRGGMTPDIKIDNPVSSISDESMLGQWPRCERAQSLQSRDPARAIDEVGEDDPYRVILFSDIRPFLVWIPASQDGASGREVLLNGFLAFCHLPPRSIMPEACFAWWTDPFIRNETLGDIGEPLLRWYSRIDHHLSALSGEESHSGLPNPEAIFQFPVQHYMTSTDEFFAKTTNWFSAFGGWEWIYVRDTGPVRIQWVRNILKSLVEKQHSARELPEYLLALESEISVNTGKKSAKTLLKRHPDNLCLYCAYALLQYRAETIDAANSVVVTTINMSESLDESDRKDIILLWRSWIWKLIESGQIEQARSRFLIFPSSKISATTTGTRIEEVSPAAVLRTQRALVDGRQQMLAIGADRLACLYSECLALLAYLTDKETLHAALASFASSIEFHNAHCHSGSLVHELIHQARAKLLHYHTTHTKSYKPALVRSILAESVAKFPQNTMFLSLYAWNERRFRIDDAVRSTMQDVLLHNTADQRQNYRESVIPHFFAVYTELNRGITLGSNVHSIRGTFERALDSQSGKTSAAMWKLYFLFEHSRDELHKAKSIFYRSIRACPWTKELYLLPFEYLGKIMPVEELKGVYDTMVEKELRVHISLDDAFETILGEQHARLIDKR